jgi:hypothetical protein
MKNAIGDWSRLAVVDDGIVRATTRVAAAS